MMFYDVNMFYVLRAFLVSFCRSVPPEFLRSFSWYLVIHIEEHIHNMIAMQNKQMTICENISGPPVDPTDIFATRMLIHTSSLV